MTTMTFADAIRLGAMNRPQAFFRAFDGVGTCANGAALEAVGRLPSAYIDVVDVWAVASLCVTQPVTGHEMMVVSAVRELNDEYRWTREDIADWVESIERAQPRSGTVDELSHHSISAPASAAQ